MLPRELVNGEKDCVDMRRLTTLCGVGLFLVGTVFRLDLPERGGVSPLAQSRFPRILRWRTDKQASEADNLERVKIRARGIITPKATIGLRTIDPTTVEQLRNSDDTPLTNGSRISSSGAKGALTSDAVCFSIIEPRRVREVPGTHQRCCERHGVFRRLRAPDDPQATVTSLHRYTS